MLTHVNAVAQTPARVLVLGCNGFVGRELVGHLAARKTPFLALGRNDIDLAAPNAAERLAAVLQSDDALVFLAALTPDKGNGIPPFLANLRMGEAVGTALEHKAVAHFVYVSSDAVYPFRTGLVNEESCAEPTDLYGAMHLARELMVKLASKTPVAVLRPTLIYGVGDTHNSYGPNRFRRAARKDRRIALFGQGEETRDHIFVGDVIRLIYLVLEHRSAGLLNVATGHSITYADLAKRVAALFAEPIEIAGAARQSPISHRSFDITAVHRSFPDFSFMPLDQGLALVHRQDAG
jgi:UDP-glucose 4-epimerase